MEIVFILIILSLPISLLIIDYQLRDYSFATSNYQYFAYKKFFGVPLIKKQTYIYFFRNRNNEPRFYLKKHIGMFDNIGEGHIWANNKLIGKIVYKGKLYQVKYYYKGIAKNSFTPCYIICSKRNGKIKKFLHKKKDRRYIVRTSDFQKSTKYADEGPPILKEDGDILKV